MKYSPSKSWLAVLLSAATMFSSSFAAVAVGDPSSESAPEESSAASFSASPLPGNTDNNDLYQQEADVVQQIQSGSITPKDLTIAVPSADEVKKKTTPAENIIEDKTTDEATSVIKKGSVEKTEDPAETPQEIIIPGRSYRELYPEYYTAVDQIEIINDPDAPTISTIDEYRDRVAGRKKGSADNVRGSNSQLPSSLDHSQTKYFPAIGDQNPFGSCGCFANVYYLMTYEYNRVHDITCTPENTMSPKFIYDMLNGGDGRDGTNAGSIHSLMTEWGVPTMDLVPYDDDCSSLSPGKEIYRNAANHRVADYCCIGRLGEDDDCLIYSPDSEELSLIKTILADGHALSFSTYIFGFREDELKQADGVNVGHVGEKVVLACDKPDGAHGMTIVGYDDNIWADINGNNEIDDGEMGAFKIANSWGEGYCNKGFCWVAYDALNYRSVVANGYNAEKRWPIFSEIYWINVVKNASPHYFVEYTLRTDDRKAINPQLNVTWANSTLSESLNPESNRSPDLSLNFQGKNGVQSATFVYDLENLTNKLGCNDLREADFSIQLIDNYPSINHTAQLLSIKIYDENDPDYYYSFDYPTPLVFKRFSEAEEIPLVQGVSNNALVYYRGYDKPSVHYRFGSGYWAEEKMEYKVEEIGYVYKCIIPLGTHSSVSLYFTDEAGNIDNNNGKYYTAAAGLNHFATEGVGTPFTFRFMQRADREENDIDLGMYDSVNVSPQGGYEPYRFRTKLENLDTGETIINDDFGDYKKFDSYLSVRNPGINYETEGHFRLTVIGEDSSGALYTNYYLLNVSDFPLQYVSIECSLDPGEITFGKSVTFTASDAHDNVMPFDHTHYFYVLHEGRIVYKEALTQNTYYIDPRTSKVTTSYIPEYSGHYTAMFTRNTRDNEFASISYDFDVADHGLTLGDLSVTPGKNLGVCDRITAGAQAQGGSGDYTYSLACRHYTQETMVEENSAGNMFVLDLPTEPGPYTLILTVRDSDGRMAYKERNIWVNPPHLTGMDFEADDLYTNTDIPVSVEGECLSRYLTSENYIFTLVQGNDEFPLTTREDKKGILNVSAAGTYRVRARIVVDGVVLASMVREVTVEENPVPEDILIYVAVISHIEKEGSQSDYRLHYWNSSKSGNVTLESTGKTVTKSIGSAYWSGAEKTFTLYEAHIPLGSTGFKFHIGSRWFGSDGVVGKSNCAYIFNYSGDKCLYDTLTL